MYASMYGTPLAALGLGAGVRAALVALAAERLDTTRGLVVTAVLSGGTLAWLGVSRDPWSATVAAVLSGAPQAAFMADAYAATQRLVADRLRGRVASMSGMLTAGSMSLLAPACGALVHSLSASAVMVGTGSAFVHLVLLVARSPAQGWPRAERDAHYRRWGAGNRVTASPADGAPLCAV